MPEQAVVHIQSAMSLSNNPSLGQLVGSIPIRRNLPEPSKRDEFEWSQVCQRRRRSASNPLHLQWQSATKAINNSESPAKEKHVRSKRECRAV